MYHKIFWSTIEISSHEQKEITSCTRGIHKARRHEETHVKVVVLDFVLSQVAQLIVNRNMLSTTQHKNQIIRKR